MTKFAIHSAPEQAIVREQNVVSLEIYKFV